MHSIRVGLDGWNIGCSSLHAVNFQAEAFLRHAESGNASLHARQLFKVYFGHQRQWSGTRDRCPGEDEKSLGGGGTLRATAVHWMCFALAMQIMCPRLEFSQRSMHCGHRRLTRARCQRITSSPRVSMQKHPCAKAAQRSTSTASGIAHALWIPRGCNNCVLSKHCIALLGARPRK